MTQVRREQEKANGPAWFGASDKGTLRVLASGVREIGVGGTVGSGAIRWWYRVSPGSCLCLFVTWVQVDAVVPMS